MPESSNNNEPPAISGKRYLSTVEVIELCGVRREALRSWERQFPQLQPIKRLGNRRYYRRQDLLIIRRIHSLLYKEGLTFAGARKRLDAEFPSEG